MSGRALQEILGRAIVELREALAAEPAEAGSEAWDPDAIEAIVREFTQELGQQMLQVWAEVRTEQAEAQAPFAPAVGEDTTCSAGNASGG